MKEKVRTQARDWDFRDCRLFLASSVTGADSHVVQRTYEWFGMCHAKRIDLDLFPEAGYVCRLHNDVSAVAPRGCSAYVFQNENGCLLLGFPPSFLVVVRDQSRPTFEPLVFDPKVRNRERSRT